MVGPCRFGGWDENGNPIGVPVPSPLVQVAAVSEEQTKNTTSMFRQLISEKMADAFGMEVGAENIWARDRKARLTPVTSNYRSLEGGRSTFVVLNESHHWHKGNNGDLMWQTIDGNTTKGNAARYLAITNAFLPGEESVAETMRRAYDDIQEGRAVDNGFLYDSIEAHPDFQLDAESLALGIPLLRGDSVWLDPETITSSVMSTDMPASRSRRMWLNQIVAMDESLVSQSEWDVLEHENPEERLMPGDDVVLGFDGGKNDDATALVAIRIKDSFAQALIIEEKPRSAGRDDEWEVNRDRVDAAVHRAFAQYNVKAFYADVALWESYIADWSHAYGEALTIKAGDKNAIAWDMRGASKSTKAHELLLGSIYDRRLTHVSRNHPDERVRQLALTLRTHVTNARRQENIHGVSFGKESRSSTKKIDAYAALMLANTALNDLRQKGLDKPKSSGRTWFF